MTMKAVVGVSGCNGAATRIGRCRAGWLTAGLGLWLAWSSAAVAAQPLSLHQMLSRLLDTYPSLTVAELQVERAEQETALVRSQLGWLLTGRFGGAHDTTFTGAPTDTGTASAGVQRKLSSGSTLGLNGSYTYEDSTFVLGPEFPNPSHATGVDLSYRQPLARGAGNPDYKQGMVSAEAALTIAKANRQALRDQVAGQAIELYYAAVFTRARIANAEQALSRARRLQRYILNNKKLGLSEEKDVLQSEAQLRARTAELRGLQVLWEQQRTGLNRLMARPWDEEFTPLITSPFAPMETPLTALVEEAETNSSDVQRDRARIEQAEAVLALSRDRHRNKLDLVLSVGNRTRSGDSVTGEVNESDRAGSVSLEFSRALDQQGLDAAVNQALLDRSMVLQEIQLHKDDVCYNVSGLYAEINASTRALEEYRRRLVSERAKLQEAVKRYELGRTDTASIIQFESELYASELLVEQQTVELVRKRANMEMMRGTIWHEVVSINPPREGNAR